MTEVDAKSVESQRKLARSIARGSFLLYGACDFAKAAGHLSHALELAQGIGDDGLLAMLQHHIGIALKEDGKLKWAEAMQEKALLSAQRANETRMRGRALKALGVICMDLHDLSKALDYQQEALALALAEKDTELEARVYANLGNIASVHMQFGHALSCHKRDLRLSSLSHAASAVGQLRAHQNLALVYAKLGKGELQQQHEQQTALLENGSCAFARDMKTHPRDAIGNVYMQLVTRDASLQELIANSILEIVSECDTAASSTDHNTNLAAGDSRAACTSRHGDGDNDTPAPVVQPVLVKQVLITKTTGGFSPTTRTQSMVLGSSSSLKHLS